MAGGDMPISASVATASSNPNAVYAGSLWIFDSPGAGNGAGTFTPTFSDKTNATAESSAASGSGRAATTGVGTGIGDGASNSPGGGHELLYIGAALAALYIYTRRGK